MDAIDLGIVGALLASSLRLCIPLAFAALGGLLCERAGVFNVALEGCLMAGAFGAALGAYFSGDPFVGVLLALMAAGLTGMLLATLAVPLGVNQLVSGIAINILVLGLTSFLARMLFAGDGSRVLAGFEPIAIPGLSGLPLLGPLLFNQDLLTYAMFALTALSWYVIYRTPLGLRIRAIGDYPQAADSVGIDVNLLRYGCVVVGCMLAGLGGAYLVLSQVHLFTEHMSSGKGYIALAALILGRWNPLGAVAACFLFGLSDAVQLQLQFTRPDIPYQLFSMLPFLAALVALMAFSGRGQGPAAIGIRFVRGGK
jgi:simple sugar transport system permease protein